MLNLTSPFNLICLVSSFIRYSSCDGFAMRICKSKQDLAELKLWMVRCTLVLEVSMSAGLMIPVDSTIRAGCRDTSWNL
jgi:hypothetical protein